MNRPIKFRAWDEEHEVMITDFKSAQHKPYLAEDGMLVRSTWYHLMQFTGLFDKNGKEIYEGDIVQLRLLGNKTSFGDIRDAEVKWDDYRMCFYADFNYDPKEFWELVQDRRVHVIGNIYENSDLLV